MTTELPPLPATDWLLHMPAAPYEPDWTSSQDGYSAEDMLAYAAEAVRLARQQALEEAALMCDRRFLQGGDDDAVSVDMASAIRDLKDCT